MKCVIFDMDGTLINSEKCYYQVWEKLIGQAGYSLNTTFYKTILGCPTTEIEELFLAYFGADFPFKELFTAFMKTRKEYIDQVHFELTPGILRFFDLCEAQRVTCGVATSSHKDEATQLLKSIGVWNRLHFSAFGDDIKMASRILKFLIRQSNVRAFPNKT
ncbi:hypothetical protein NRIC_09640 [Enterococcus florum]|uniref:Haloacid dehalogenase n=1 Tax=Enterococcus florum TaxID=2480627 RepID=A0A4P5PI66_9ENTE|nr:HAD family phosphatase [Enterococcus florum]GCF93073.1 hypothetical protein NRIC_09640 [Enterococcus florum]